MLKYEYLSKYSFAEMGKEIQLRAHALKVIASLIYHYYSPEKKKKVLSYLVKFHILEMYFCSELEQTKTISICFILQVFCQNNPVSSLGTESGHLIQI